MSHHNMSNMEGLNGTQGAALLLRQAGVETSKKKKVEGIAFNKPTLSKRELKSVLECMVQDELSFGKIALQFERDFAKAFEFRKGISSPSLTSSYHLAYMTLELEEGDEVILSSHAPVAALDALGYVKADAVLVDLDKDSFHPSVEKIIDAVTDKTKAIILSYPYGSYKNYEELRQYLVDNNKAALRGGQIHIIEDLSYIAGSENGGRVTGSDGDLAIIGLHSDMMMTTGKGGMLLIDSNKLYAIAKDLRIQGGDRPYRVRYDYSIPDYQAAMGIEQLNNLSQLIERRRQIGDRFLEAISFSKLSTFFNTKTSDAYGAFPVMAEGSLENLIRYFSSLNIEVHRLCFSGPLHNLTGAGPKNFPNAERMYQRSVLLPVYPYLTKMNVERITGAIKGYY